MGDRGSQFVTEAEKWEFGESQPVTCYDEGVSRPCGPIAADCQSRHGQQWGRINFARIHHPPSAAVRRRRVNGQRWSKDRPGGNKQEGLITSRLRGPCIVYVSLTVSKTDQV
uniref:Integrase catalytic domain-containing protein n=1 Tax=Steinernema glaseri TaxID=37863 RepID=A0A1I7XYS2_9BILA